MKYFLQISLIGFFLIQCKSDNLKTDIIATLNDRDISIEEFRSFYNFDVNFGIDSTGIDALEDELLFYCDQIRAVDRAKKEGLINDTVFVRSFTWEKERAMLRQLYRQEVLSKVSVSEQELKTLFRKQQANVNLQHLFFKTRNGAARVYKQLRNNKTTFDTEASKIFKDDSLAASGGRIGWIKISDLDEQLATELINLPINVVSQPVKSKWGYHLLLYKDKKISAINTESEFVKNIPSLKKKIRAQKSGTLSSNFINSYIGEVNPQLNTAAFEKFWNAVVPKYSREKDALEHKVEITRNQLNDLRNKLKDSLADHFIDYRGGHISIESFLDDLDKMPLSERFVFKSKKALSNQIGKWIRDKFLLEKAYQDGLADHDRVLRETRRFMEEQSYYYYHSQVSDTIKVPQRIKDHFSKQSPVNGKKHQIVNKYHTLQEWQFETAKRLLREYFKSADRDLQINYKILKQENDSIDWDNKIRMFMVRKPQ